MSHFATAYTIHFDDTMAYGSHHFLTAFKFQCAGRESLLYGDLIFDRPGVRESLDKIHLLTADAYSRNLSPAMLGDRVAILIRLEEWGRVSARFCYRVLGQQGQPICAGFQTMICTDAGNGQPIPLPKPLREAFDALRQITEPEAEESFRNRVLSGAEATVHLFSPEVRELAQRYLSDRYPTPRVVSLADFRSSHAAPAPSIDMAKPDGLVDSVQTAGGQSGTELTGGPVWVFPGQGAFDAELLCSRIATCLARWPELRQELDECAAIAAQQLGGDTVGLVLGSSGRCRQAVSESPHLSQLAIYLQSVLGARLLESSGEPAILMGHSFGEVAALTVAGCFDLPTGVAIVCHRVQAIERYAPAGGGLLVATSDRPTLAEEIAASGLTDLVIAGRNHPRQTVVSGPREQLHALREHLQRLGIHAISIASPTSFHHPSLRDAAMAWLQPLQRIPISRPSRIVFSPIGRRMVTVDDDIAAVLTSQFVRPFDLQGAIDDLVAGGFTTFIDCGSSGSLARLLKDAGPNSIQVYRVEDFAAPFQAKDKAPTAAGSSPVVGDRKCDAQVQPHAARSSAQKQGRPRIAIVGQGCALPGGATSPAELHAAIAQARLGIVDQCRFDPDWERDFYSASLVPDRSTSALAGRVEHIAAPPGVDGELFSRFSRAQQLLCMALHPCVDALRDKDRIVCLVGSTADGFEDQDRFAALRFAGVATDDPEVLQRMGRPRSAVEDPYAAVREVLDQVVRPGLDLTLVDAACASSLYAVAMGMRILENHEADVVLVGGVFCPGPGNNCLFSQFGGLTSTGCRPFDAAADGVVFSEGAACIVLRRLDDARQLGQRIDAIVRGAGLSSDGRSSSANVPRTAGQLLALQRCYASYDIDPSSITAIEGHGTSTPVGDATEMNTLREFFGPHARSPIPLHSLKGVVGHAGWAAGTASVIAACEMLRTGWFPAQAFHQRPSKALADSATVLSVPTQPLRLPPTGGRIAINGFGFGGANAHVVIESYVEPATDVREHAMACTNGATKTDDESQLVIVAWDQLSPENDGESSNGHGPVRFDRRGMALPDGMTVLPDLADDMDITQVLAVRVVDATLAKLERFDDEQRRQTGIVLALGGKTERAVEAIPRVLAQRLSRDLQGLPASAGMQDGATVARPSGPYTLQCMMPNVSAGRAALQLNLNGPNFVVDAGPNSLEAAFSSAAWLLQGGDESGARLVVVAAINANRWAVPGTDAARIDREYAAAFAVTTRQYANEMGMQVLRPLVEMRKALESPPQMLPTTARKVAHCAEWLQMQSEGSREVATAHDDEFPIHTPVWIEAAAEARGQAAAGQQWLIIAPADMPLVTELIESLPEFCHQALILVTGPGAGEVAERSQCPWVIAFAADAWPTDGPLATLLSPDAIIAVDRPHTWDLADVIEMTSRSQLCESLFVATQAFASQIEQGLTEVWGLFPGGWNGIIHPATGAVAGFIKATQRECPRSRMGVLSLSGSSMPDALANLQRERAERHVEPEVVHDGDRRLVRRLRGIGDKVMSAPAGPHVVLGPESVVIASGGARGVTAVVCEALLRDYGCTVVCLGRSPLEKGPAEFNSTQVEQDYYQQFLASHPGTSPVEMKQSLEAARARWEAEQTISHLKSMGGNIDYLTVDVTDRDDVRRAVQQIVDRHGRVDLIIHGAGVQWSKRLTDRRLVEFRRTLAVKLSGLDHLIDSCHRRLGKPVPAHILTSAYSIFGNDGQHDYGAANEALDRLCGLANANGELNWSSIAWSAWNAIGMTRGSEYRALAEMRNLALIDQATGQRIFRTVIEGRTHCGINAPVSQAERTRYRARTIPPMETTTARRVCEVRMPLAELDCLAFHRARGTPTLPGAWIFDFMVRAAQSIAEEPASYFSVEAMRFHRFVRVADGHDPNVRVVVEATPRGYHAWMIGDVINSAGVTLSTDQLFAEAVLTTRGASTLPRPSLNGMHGNGSVRLVTDPYCAGEQSVQLTGPFDCLNRIEIGPLGRRAIFSPAVCNRWHGQTPALLLDAALRVAGMHLVPDALHVPTRIDRAVVPVGFTTDSSAAAGWQIRTSDPQANGDNISCALIEVTDEQGDLKLYVEGAQVTRLR